MTCGGKTSGEGLYLKNVGKKTFMMSRDCDVNLVAELRPYISPNHRALSAEKKVAVALYFLKDTGSLRVTANSFGIALNTASSVITEVCNIFTLRFVKYLHLPKDDKSMREKVA